jgi:uncharacterized protein YndB with AHSA1/START domain/DNA-binding winged helix-turn-helix (wHTH) protein
MQPSHNRQLYEFEGFRLDAWRRVLYAPDGARIPLKPKIFETLLYFVRHRGELLQKPQLLRALWGDVVVDENGLNQHVATLRRLLGERPGDNRFIVTVPRCGYRFVASLTPSAPTDGPTHALAYLRCSATRPWAHQPLTFMRRSECGIVFSRVYPVPRKRVFVAWTDGALQRRWWVLPGWSIVECESNVRVGGTWRQTLCGPGGVELCQHGVYREVAPIERLVYTETRTGSEAGEMLVSVAFSDGGDKTLQTIAMGFRSRRARDAMLRSRASSEMTLRFDQLAALLQKDVAGLH